MKYLFFSLLLISPLLSYGQDSFWKEWLTTVPLVKDPSLSHDLQIKKCNDFLLKSQNQRDSFQLLCAYGLLFHTHMEVFEYAEANLDLVKAEVIALSSGKPERIGWVEHKKGILNLVF